MNKLTTQIFINKANEVHNKKFEYCDAQYTAAHEKVIITCPIHGNFEQRANDHLNGSGCPKCSSKLKYTKDTFIEAAREIHGNLFDYSRVEYKNNKTKVKIVCPKHGEFEMSANTHLRGGGCKECNKDDRFKEKFKELIEKARNKHNNKYDYSKVEPCASRKKVTIICPVHGEFKQSLDHHANAGIGCPLCGNDAISKHHKANKHLFSNNTWTYSGWENAGKESEHFEGFSVYVIKCTSKNEEFIKVGKTFKSVAKRFAGCMPYKYKIVTQVYCKNGYAASKLEEKVKKEFKDRSYIPERDFGGSSECLSIDAIDDVVKMVEM